jgi:glycosyltransferase involved in cell wall biosynthesis
MFTQRIVLLTGNPLASNPRVLKEAAALTEAGFEVAVLGAWSTEQGVETDKHLAERGGYTFAPLLPPNTREGKLHRVVRRVVRKFMPWSRWSMGLMPAMLRREAARLQPALAIAHSEAALFAAQDLHAKGLKVGVDMEDWFSEDLPPEARKGRPVAALRRAEQQLLRCAVHATCTSEAMADALVQGYECPRPLRIYNVFPRSKETDGIEVIDRAPAVTSLGGTSSKGLAVPSIHWFSQTIGPGRGLDDLFQAAAGIPRDFEIHLRGHLGPYRSWLDRTVPPSLLEKVFVHPIVDGKELPVRIAEHDIGFAGETASIRSRDLTATNKIFQYLQAGLVVLASDTRGQREVAAAAEHAVELYQADNVSSLQAVLVGMLSDAAVLRQRRSNAQKVAENRFSWSKERDRLVSSVQAAVIV